MLSLSKTRFNRPEERRRVTGGVKLLQSLGTSRDVKVSWSVTWVIIIIIVSRLTLVGLPILVSPPLLLIIVIYRTRNIFMLFGETN